MAAGRAVAHERIAARGAKSQWRKTWNPLIVNRVLSGPPKLAVTEAWASPVVAPARPAKFAVLAVVALGTVPRLDSSTSFPVSPSFLTSLPVSELFLTSLPVSEPFLVSLPRTVLFLMSVLPTELFLISRLSMVPAAKP